MFLGKAFLGIHWVLEGLILGFSVVGFQVVHTFDDINLALPIIKHIP